MAFRDIQIFKKMLKRSLLRKDKPTVTDDILQKLKPGDHICSERMNDNYKHHGIYVGENRVIHLQGPHKVNKESVPCEECGYEPRRDGTVVKTCIDCFRVGHSLCICEYGIRVSEGVMESCVSQKLNSDGMIYTCRKQKVFLGIWTDKKTVIHLAKPRYGCVGSTPCQECGFRKKMNFKFLFRKKHGHMVETCLECFLRGGLLFINEHQLHVTGINIDTWISYNDYDILKFIDKIFNETPFVLQRKFKKLCTPIFRLLKVPFDQESKYSLVVYRNKRVQVYAHHCMNPADQVVHEADRYLQVQFGNYDLFMNNCEHFAFMCKTNVARSTQVTRCNRKLVTLLARITGAIIALSLLSISPVLLFI